MKILVTGSAGFIGYHLSKRLLEAGNQVVGIDSINDYYDVRLKYARLETAGIHRNLVAKRTTGAERSLSRLQVHPNAPRRPTGPAEPVRN